MQYSSFKNTNKSLFVTIWQSQKRTVFSVITTKSTECIKSVSTQKIHSSNPTFQCEKTSTTIFWAWKLQKKWKGTFKFGVQMILNAMCKYSSLTIIIFIYYEHKA
jgi:hypothetical protein